MQPTPACRLLVYRGYWLSSPFEREVRVVQQWRQQRSFDWVVEPDLDALMAGPGSSQPPASPAPRFEAHARRRSTMPEPVSDPASDLASETGASAPASALSSPAAGP
jgi:hypothetical protein